jgi:hypothetical protein
MEELKKAKREMEEAVKCIMLGFNGKYPRTKLEINAKNITSIDEGTLRERVIGADIKINIII